MCLWRRGRQGPNVRAAGTEDREKQVRARVLVRLPAPIWDGGGGGAGLATLARAGGPRRSLWGRGCDPATARWVVSWSQPASLLGGAVRAEPRKRDSGRHSQKGEVAVGRGAACSAGRGSPGRVALVMAASGPVWGLRQRQALPEVLQLCLELLPFQRQLLPLGHQLLRRP